MTLLVIGSVLGYLVCGLAAYIVMLPRQTRVADASAACFYAALWPISATCYLLRFAAIAIYKVVLLPVHKLAMRPVERDRLLSKFDRAD